MSIRRSVIHQRYLVRHLAQSPGGQIADCLPSVVLASGICWSRRSACSGAVCRCCGGWP